MNIDAATLTLIGALAGALLGGVNLAFVLKILYNDLHELRVMLMQHLRDHAQK